MTSQLKVNLDITWRVDCEKERHRPICLMCILETRLQITGSHIEGIIACSQGGLV